MNRRVPVSVDQEFDVKIEAVGEKGDGIARVQGFVLFVPGVKEGDNVRIRVTKVLQKVGFAEVVTGSSKATEDSQDEPAKEVEAKEAPADQPEDSDNFGEEEDDSQSSSDEEEDRR